MRRSVARILKLGISAIIGAGLAALLVVLYGLFVVDRAFDNLVDVSEPAAAAAYEMEINAIGAGLGVLKYLQSSEPTHRARVDKDEQDFRHFMGRFDSLAANDAEARELGVKVARLYDEYILLGRAPMDGRDREWVLFDAFAADMAKLDRVIEDDLLARIDRDAKDGTAKALAASQLEADLAEVGTWLGVYLTMRRPQPKVRDGIEDFRGGLAHLKRLALTPSERRVAAQIGQLFDRIVALAEEITAMHQTAQADLKRFIELREAIDGVLDEGIQALTSRRFAASKAEVDRLMAALLGGAGGPLLMFIAVGAVAGVRAYRSIVGPVRVVMAGANEVREGDLPYRLSTEGMRAKFAELGDGFNRMVARLEESTVSKERLAKSEERFRDFTEMSSDWYWEQDENFRFTFLSGSSAEKGRSPAGLALGKSRWELAKRVRHCGRVR